MKIISTEAALGEFIEGIQGIDWISVDTEFLREKTYSPKLCLIQISTAHDEVCIDPLAIEDLNPLESILSDHRTIKILHSCRQDLEAFDTRMDGVMGNLFDTQIAAAFCGYGDQVSYASLVESICGVVLPKLYTRADWSKRPLPSPQLEYAIEDVRYLDQIRHKLDEMLIASGRKEWHDAECLSAVDPNDYRIDPNDAWKRLKGANNLGVAYHQCAKALAIWRERQAQDSDRPREWVLASAALLEVSSRMPTDERQLGQIEGINSGVIRKSGNQILEIVRENQPNDDDQPVWRNAGMLTPEEKKKIKSIMKMLKTFSEENNLAQALLSNRQNIERFVRGDLDIPLFHGWRFDLIGKEVLNRFQERD